MLKIYTNNTTEEQNKNLHDSLSALGNFCKADSIEYTDEGKGETYTIIRGKKKLTLTISGNLYDGGYMSIKLMKE